MKLPLIAALCVVSLSAQTSISSVSGSDRLSDSRSTINSNFNSLNTYKVEGRLALVNLRRFVVVSSLGTVGESVKLIETDNGITVTGAITGNLTGNVTGNVTGGTGYFSSLTIGTSSGALKASSGVVGVVTGSASNCVKVDGSSGSCGGSGDASTNTSSSVDGEAVLFSGTGGKTLKRSTLTGVLKSSSGVPAVVTGTSTNCVLVDGTSAACSGLGGDASTNTSTSVDGESVLFSGTGGKTLKRSTLTATVVKSASGVRSAATAGSDYSAPGTTETTSGDRTFTGAVVATGASSTAPNKSGTSLPGTCTVGQTYFKTDATAGQNHYGCTASNTWSVLGAGDVSSNTSTSVDGEVALFSNTGGKTIKRATLTASVVKSASGVQSAATAGSDYSAPGTAETTSANRTFTGALVATGASRTAPNKSGTSLPATCTVGDTYFKTDATTGRNVYGCTSTDTWTVQGDGTAAAVAAADLTDLKVTVGSASVLNVAAGTYGNNADAYTMSATSFTITTSSISSLHTASPARLNISSALYAELVDGDTTMVTVTGGSGCSALSGTHTILKYDNATYTIQLSPSVDATGCTGLTGTVGGTGTGTALVEATHDGMIKVIVPAASGALLVRSGTTTWEQQATPAYDVNNIPLGSVTITQSGGFSIWNTATDKRRLFRNRKVTTGDGLSFDATQTILSLDSSAARRTAANTWTNSNDFSAGSMRLPNASSDPGSCSVGQKYWNTTSNKFRNCTASNTWSDEGGSSAPATVKVDWQKQASNVSTTTGADATIFTKTITGGTMGAGGCLEIDAFTTQAGASETVDYKLSFGGTSIVMLDDSNTTGTVRFEILICNGAGVTNAQQVTYRYIVGNGFSGGTVIDTSTYTKDTTADQALVIQARAVSGNTNTTPGGFLVKVIK